MSQVVSIDAANQLALHRMRAADPVLVGVATVAEVIPGAHKRRLYHAGPPLTWQKMSGPMRGAVYAALMYEGLASSPEEADTLAASGQIEFMPCHVAGMVGPMTGVTSYSMPLYVVENRAPEADGGGNRAYSTINEGMGDVLRFGAYTENTVRRLKWIETVWAPVLKRILEAESEGVRLTTMIGKALQMGDELHMRNTASTSLLTNWLLTALIKIDIADETRREIARFLTERNDQLFLNVAMAANKAAADAADGVPGSTMIVAMARNGVDVGLRVSGLPGEWFTAPAPPVNGLYFPGYSQADACPDIGDSAIMETVGMGAFAMAVAPSIIQFIGIDRPQTAIEITDMMYEISVGEHERYRSLFHGGRGLPLGIDVIKVVETGIVPRITTAIAHKNAGVGMIGAGVAEVPFEVFADALVALDERGMG